MPGSTSGAAVIQPAAAAGTPTLTLPTTTGTIALTSDIPSLTGYAALSSGNAFTGANSFANATGQTFTTATTTQDGIIIVGRSGGTASRRATIQPGTLSGNITLTLPVSTGTIALTSDIPSLTGYAQLSGATFTGNIAINNGTSTALTTTGTTAALFDSGATTLNIGSAGTTVSIGATSGTMTLNNPTIVGSQTTQALFNTVATTVNAFGAATTVNISSGTTAASTLTIGGVSANVGQAATIKTKDATSGTGALTIATGANTGGSGVTSGNISIDVGAGNAGTAGSISIGTTNATSTTLAKVTLNAGTSSAAPLKFTSGTNLTSVAAGAVEYNGTNLFFTTNTTSGRGLVENKYVQVVNGDGGTASYATTQSNIFGLTAPAINLEASSMYRFKGVYIFNIGGATATNLVRVENVFSSAPTLTRHTIQGWQDASNTAIFLRTVTGTGTSGVGWTSSPTIAVSATGLVTVVWEGVIMTNAATKLTPKFAMSATGTGPGTPNSLSVQDGSFIEITKLASSTTQTVSGGWTT